MANQLTDSQLTVGVGSVSGIFILNSSYPYLTSCGYKSVSVPITDKGSTSNASITLSTPSVGSTSSGGLRVYTNYSSRLAVYLPPSGKYLVGDYNYSGISNLSPSSTSIKIDTVSDIKSGGANYIDSKESGSWGSVILAVAAYRLS